MKKLSDNLKIYAKKLGLSDSEIARRSRLSEVRYGHYVRGRSEPDMTTLLRICKVLNVTPNDLLLTITDKPRAPSKISKTGAEMAILRNRITAGIGQLNKQQLHVIHKVIDELIGSVRAKRTKRKQKK